MLRALNDGFHLFNKLIKLIIDFFVSVLVS